MTRTSVALALLFCAAPVAQPAAAASSLSLGSGAIIYPGEPFTMNVSLSAAVPFSQLDLYLVASGSPANAFSITSRTSTWNGNTTNPLTIPNTDTLPANYIIPNAGSSLDLGYSAADTSSNLSPGNYAIESIALTAATSLPSGTYNISTVPGLIGTQLIDSAGNNTDLSAAFSLTVTLPGDANLDGHVTSADLALVLQNFGQSTSAWTSGNFDGQPTIDLTDLADVLNNLGQTSPSPAVPTPEPASLIVLSAGGISVLRRRRRFSSNS